MSGFASGGGEQWKVGLGVAKTCVERMDDLGNGASVEFEPGVGVVKMDLSGWHGGRMRKAEIGRPNAEGANRKWPRAKRGKGRE